VTGVAMFTFGKETLLIGRRRNGASGRPSRPPGRRGGRAQQAEHAGGKQRFHPQLGRTVGSPDGGQPSAVTAGISRRIDFAGDEPYAAVVNERDWSRRARRRGPRGVQ